MINIKTLCHHDLHIKLLNSFPHYINLFSIIVFSILQNHSFFIISIFFIIIIIILFIIIIIIIILFIIILVFIFFIIIIIFIFSLLSSSLFSPSPSLIVSLPLSSSSSAQSLYFIIPSFKSLSSFKSPPLQRRTTILKGPLSLFNILRVCLYSLSQNLYNKILLDVSLK